MNSVVEAMLILQLCLLAFPFSVVFTWALLACVINPTLVGYLVMIAGVAIVVRVLVGKIGDLQGMVDEVLNSISWTCLRTVLEEAIKKIPVETELQKKVKQKEREEFEEAIINLRKRSSKSSVKESSTVDMAQRFVDMGIEPLVEVDDDDESGLPPDVNELAETLYQGQLKLMKKFPMDVQELVPEKLADTVNKALNGVTHTMRGLADEYLQVIENERKDQVMVVYKDVITALTDHYVIDLAITSSLNDVISEVINAKFRSMLSPLLPSSAVAQMRKRVKKFADESRSPEPRPGQRGRAVGADLSESDRLLLENDEPRILKAELPSLFILAGLFTDETSERTGDPTPRDMADGMVLKDASENTFEVQACKLGDFSKKA